ncbi:MAG: YopX family protein [Cyanobacteria bacterium RUI128]|nr:YopX family protein [Cyanobacteria bacterium RUI128]
MKDRFKFRVWYMPEYDKSRMIYGAENTYDCMYGEPEIIYADCFGSLLDSKEYILMQSTGLKDKNGTLIYEGDICEYEFEDIGKQKAIIYFNNKYASFLKKPLNDFQYAEINDCKVIGNIYENKELLEDTECQK